MTAARTRGGRHAREPFQFEFTPSPAPPTGRLLSGGVGRRGASRWHPASSCCSCTSRFGGPGSAAERAGSRGGLGGGEPADGGLAHHPCANGLETTISPAPPNYKDSSGNWQPIDNTLVADTKTGYAWKNTAAGYTVEFPASLAAGPVTVTANGQSVSSTLPGAATTAGKVSGSTITKTNALPGRHQLHRWTSWDQRNHHPGRRGGRDGTPRRACDPSSGLSLTADSADSGASINDAQGIPAFVIPPATAEDAAGVPATGVQAALALGVTAKAVTPLSVALDPTWLTAASRKFPITIDPTVSLPVNTPGDCTLASGAYANTDGCPNTSLEIGQYPGVLLARSILHFDVSSIPPSAVVRHAQLQLTAQSTSPSPLSTTLTMEVHNLTHPTPAAPPGTTTTAPTPGRPPVATSPAPSLIPPPPPAQSARVRCSTGSHRRWCRAGSTALLPTTA